MRGYKIVARILLMLSVINFALTAPALVRKHQVRAIGSNDGAGPSNPAPPIDSPSPSLGPSSTAAPPDEPHPLNPTSPLAHGQGLTDDSQKSNPLSPDDGPTHENYHLDVNSAPLGNLRFKYLSELGPTIHGPATSYPGFHPPYPPDFEPAWLRQMAASPESPQIVSSPDNSYSSSSWTSQDSASPPPWVPQGDASPPPSSPEPWWASRTRPHVPPQDQGDHLPTEKSHPSSSNQLSTGQPHLSSPDQLATGEPHLPTSSTDESPSLIPGSTDSHPQPAPPSNPGPLTEPNPPPSAEPMHPEEHEISGSLGDILKGKFRLKRRFSGSGSLNEAQEGLAATFN